MNRKILLSVSFLSFLFIISCGKESPDERDCSTLTVSATVTDAENCNTGAITASSNGGNGTMYKLNAGGTYQSSATFEDVAEGDYQVFAKSADGCEVNTRVTVGSSNTLGAKFSAVKALMTAKCVSCHNGTNTQGGKNWTVDCNIADNSARINQRAVVDGTMPPTGPLTAAEKQIITDWIAAGGGINN